MSPIAVNVGETIGKTVGTRAAATDPWAIHDGLVDYAMEVMGTLPYPRGVFRFRTFEEADQWQMNHLVRAARQKFHAPPSEPTCSGSPLN